MKPFVDLFDRLEEFSLRKASEFDEHYTLIHEELILPDGCYVKHFGPSGDSLIVSLEHWRDTNDAKGIHTVRFVPRGWTYIKAMSKSEMQMIPKMPELNLILSENWNSVMFKLMSNQNFGSMRSPNTTNVSKRIEYSVLHPSVSNFYRTKDDLRLYNRLLAIIEDHMGESIENLTNGEFHYVEVI